MHYPRFLRNKLLLLKGNLDLFRLNYTIGPTIKCYSETYHTASEDKNCRVNVARMLMKDVFVPIGRGRSYFERENQLWQWLSIFAARGTIFRMHFYDGAPYIYCTLYIIK